MRITVFESSDPLLTLRLKKRLPDFAGTAPYPLDGGPSIVFAVKEDPDDTSDLFAYNSPAAIVIIADGLSVGAKYSEITVQCAAADLTPPGTYYWSLSVTKASKKDVIKKGFFDILNI